MAKRISLDYKDFDDLTSGKIVEKEGVKIALQDIGFDQMYILLREKFLKFYENQENKKPGKG
jgi:hypothetical protein